MKHVLVRGGDVATGGVVVGAEVRGGAATARGGEQERQIDRALVVDDGLRGFDHHLKLERARGKRELRLHLVEEIGERGALFGDGDLRERDDEVRRQRTIRFRDERGDEDVERANAARAQFFGERLDADADKG